MAFLLDTDWTDLTGLNNDTPALELIDSLSGQGVFITMITYMEAYEGVLREDDYPDARTALNTRLDPLHVVDFSPDVARRCATIVIP